MTSVVSRLTYDEFQALPRDGSKLIELIEGEVFMTPSPKTNHQMAAGNLYFALRKFCDEHGLGRVFFAPYDVVFSNWTALEPDLLFIRKERLSIITDHLRTVTITVPIVNYDNNQHAENENLRLQNLWDGIETLSAVMMIKPKF